MLEAVAEKFKEDAIFFDCKESCGVRVDYLENLFLKAGEKNRTRFITLLNSEFLRTKRINDDFTFTLDKTNFILQFQNLSSGEKNIVCIFALAILSKYDLICFDDIEFSLDGENQQKLMRILVEKTDKFYVIATHSPQVVSEYMEMASQIDTLFVGDYDPNGIEL